MGTNYYLHVDVCLHCKRSDPPKHIGKSSAGWTFSFRGYREAWEADPPINSWGEWLEYLRSMLTTEKAEIRDEYGDTVALDNFVRMVDSKRDEKNNHTLYCQIHHPDHANRDCWLDEEGNSFSGADFS